MRINVSKIEAPNRLFYASLRTSYSESFSVILEAFLPSKVQLEASKKSKVNLWLHINDLCTIIIVINDKKA